MTHCGKIYDRFAYPRYEPFVVTLRFPARFNGVKDTLHIFDVM